MKVYNDFLDTASAAQIKRELLGGSIPWFYSETVAIHEDKLQTKSYNNKIKKNHLSSESTPEKYNFQFTHGFYSDHMPQSNYISLLDPLIRKINPSALLRIKANLNPVCPNHYFFDAWHTDIEGFDGKTALYYVNSNNGYTLFENGDRVDCVENRLVVFDARELHTGITCTDNKARCVINLNYYEFQS